MTVAGLAFAMVGVFEAQRHFSTDLTEEFGAEMVIEFAPFVASAGSTPQPEARMVNQQDQQAMPELAENQSEQTEQDLPTEQTSPSEAEDPDLRMARERTEQEVEENPAVEQATEASKAQEQLTSSQASTSVASTPEQEGEKPTQSVTAPDHGNSREAARRIEAWQRAIFAHIGRFKIYPDEARAKAIRGEVVVFFILDRDGAVSEVRVEKGSGSTVLDQSAIDVLQRAGPLPKPPADLRGSRLEMLLPLHYRLR